MRPITLTAQKKEKRSCIFTAKRGVHKFPSDYQMCVIYGQGKMRQAREELRGGCEEAPPGEEASPGEEAATQPQALKESGGRLVTGTWAQGQSQERRAGL